MLGTMTNKNVLPLDSEACDVRNSEDCELFTPAGHMYTFCNENGVFLCCKNCEMPMTEAEEAEARAEFGDEVWDSLG
jgi:hypothetical protein